MVWIAFAIAFFCVCLGYALGMYLTLRSRGEKTGELEGTEEHLDAEKSLPVMAVAQELIQELQKLAHNVDGDINRHATQITKINDELASPEATDASTVLAAATQLMDANKRLKKDLDFAKQEMQVQQQQLDSYMNEARTDALTGVANRRAFDEELMRRFSQWTRQQIPLSLVLVDIDHFKRFNDYHGHQVGDEMLRWVAAVLVEQTREMDILARYGGEEFVVILPGTSLADATIVAERLRTGVGTKSFEIEEADLQVTVSVGFAQAMPDETEDDLVGRADNALYAAKGAGRDCVFLHDGSDVLPVASVPQGTQQTHSGLVTS